MADQHGAAPMKHGSPHKLRRMSQDLVAGLLVIVITVAGLVMGVNYLLAARKADRTLQESADQYLAYLRESLEIPIWSMDNGTVVKIADAFMASEHFALLEINCSEYSQDHMYSNQKTATEAMVLRQDDVLHNGQAIGSIKLGLSKTPYRAELQRLLKFSLMITAAIAAAVVLAAWLMLRQFVGRPLRSLMDMASEIAKGNYESRQDRFGHYETALVYNQLITMAERVKGRESSLEEANAKLQDEIERRVQTEEELRRLRNYLSSIIDSMPSALVGVDRNGKVSQWNKTAERETSIGFEQAKGRDLSELLPWMASEMDKISESIRTRQIKQDQKRSRDSNDGTRYEDVTIYPLITDGEEGAVIRIDDVTEKVRLEEMMVQSEKMLSVGGLAAGMAHEINNPLAGMLQTAEVLASRLGGKNDIPANRQAAEDAGTTLAAIEQFMDARGIPRMLAAISESGHRMAGIVHNMLSFARKGDTTVSSYDLGQLIDRTLELAATDYDLKKQYDFKRIEIIRQYSPSLAAVPCEAAKIQQVLLNILTNAAQAMQMAAITNPRLVIRTKKEEERNMAAVEIEDNGPGMEKDVCKRAFEPFFTTKMVGEGTGLGLSVSYFIITETHHGEIELQSQPGAGTTFIIRLPLRGTLDE